MQNNRIDLLQMKIDEAKSKLPKETVEAISAVDWQAAIFGLREKKGYSFEQLGDLEIETELVLCGLVSSVNYPKELEARMKLPRSQVNELVEIMNDLVFSRIKEELIKNIERKKIFEKREKEDAKVAPKISIPAPTPEIAKGEHDILKDAGINIVPVVDNFSADNLNTIPKPASTQAPAQTTPTAKNIPMPETVKLELPTPEKPKIEFHPILAQKLSGYVQNEVKETQHFTEDAIKRSKEANASAQTSTPNTIKSSTQSYSKSGDPYRLPPE